jgi:large subunit ribosomal protein L15
MKLNEINDNDGARKTRKRVGRGIGSGLGKTGGRGQKGQKSRTGVAINGYEGGQMPLYRRLPKRGFTSLDTSRYEVINVGRLQAAVDAGKLDAGKPVTEAVLAESGVISRVRDGVRVLGGGELTAKLQIEVTGASQSAIAAVEKAGGTLLVTAPVAAKTES